MQLFNRKTIARHVERAEPADPAKLEVLRNWATTIEDGSIFTQNETAIEDQFKQRIVCDVLGFIPFGSTDNWSVASKASIGSGEVDLALGAFTTTDEKIIAPFELKGAKTKDLDAIMPSRAKSPVDQAWEYAANNVGTKWVLVSNYLEIRLYSYADGRQSHESFDLAELHLPEEYQRFMLLLGAESLLRGKTAQLLADSRAEDKDITDALYADYKVLRSNLIGAVQSAKTDMDPLEAIGVGQTILDRVLFIAFAEDNGLVPDNSLANAFEHNDPYDPKPVWQTFLGLFTAIDKGSDQLSIPRYNGGLFARDEVIRELEIPDDICEGFKRLGGYDFASEISVTVLGHIFEQSIADVEHLQAEARGEVPAEKKASGTSGRRKRDGVVYTPDYVARFIVEQTLGTHCREIFDGILAEYVAKGARADDEEIKWKRKSAEQEAWEAYRKRLTSLRIVDPACGSGVFLVIAFDWMRAELERVNGKLAALSGSRDLFDPDSEILTNNLFGVDVNSESVEIAKLSLWIKTARRGKVLDSLDGNLRVGDSLIEDSSYAYREHGFVWKEAFPDVFAEGGFDVVLGNPPYVRMELIKPMKPWLKTRYEVVSDRADLYAYFFERGLKLLKPGGRLGYISSATFFKTGSSKPLRQFLLSNAALEVVVDFGDLQVFEGVTTYPAIITLRADAPDADHDLKFWTLRELPQGSFADKFLSEFAQYPQSALSSGPWQLEGPEVRELRSKIASKGARLKEIFGPLRRGIGTGLNSAFVVDEATKAKLFSEDPNSIELLRPWLEGKDLERWLAESRRLWVIYIPKGRVDIDRFPAIRNWLLPFREKLEGRATKQKWFELQQAQEAYSSAFGSTKLLSTKISNEPTFSVDSSGSFLSNTAYFFGENAQLNFLVALLNSSVSQFLLPTLFVIKEGGFFEIQPEGLEKFPIPEATAGQKDALSKLAEAAQTAAEQRYSLQQSITRRIPDLAADTATAKLSKKLKEWWTIPDFAALQKEVKKTLKAEIPLKERSEWEDWITDTRGQINALTAEIARLESEINAKVYELFGLTADEIELLEANI